MDAEVVEEAAVDGESECHGPAAGNLVLDRVRVEWADGSPFPHRVLSRFSERVRVRLSPEVGGLTVVGEHMELRISLPLEQVEGSIVGDALILSAIELVPDKATGKARALVRMSFPVGDLFDGC